MDLQQKVDKIRDVRGPAGVAELYKGVNYKNKLNELSEDEQLGSGNAVKRRLGQIPQLSEETLDTLKDQKRWGKSSVDKPINASKVKEESYKGMPNSVRYMYGLKEVEPKSEEEYRNVFEDVENELQELKRYEDRYLELSDQQERRKKELEKKRNDMMRTYSAMFGKEIYEK